MAVLAVLAVTAAAARADDEPAPRRKPPVAREQPKYKLDLSDAPTSNSPDAPPGTTPLRRDPDSGLPFLGLKLSTPLGN